MGLKWERVSAVHPSRVIDNAWFAERMDTSDEWILQRTGISQRRFVTAEDTSDLAIAAVEKLALCEEERAQIKAILVATSTPSDVMPSTAARVHTAIGCGGDCFSMDLNMACSGYVAGLRLMERLLEEGEWGILVGADVLSKTLDLNDRTTAILFGDGAGAALLQKTNGAMHFSGGTRAGNAELCLSGLSIAEDQKRPTLSMMGREVYRFSMEVVPTAIEKALTARGWQADEVDWFLLHQANARILDGVAKKLGVSTEVFPRNMQTYGNTSAASIPLLLDEMVRDGRLQRADKVVLAGFGAGLTWQVATAVW